MVSGGGVDFRTINIHQSPSRLAVDTYEVGVWHVPPLREKIIVNQWTIYSPLFQGFTPHGKGTQTHHGSGKLVVLKKAPKSSEAKLQRWVSQWPSFTTCARLPFLPWHGPKNSDSGVAKIEAGAYEQFTRFTLLGMKNSSVLWEWYRNRWTMVKLLTTLYTLGTY